MGSDSQSAHSYTSTDVSRIVRTFYETYGWTIDEANGLLYHHTYFQDMDERAIRYRYSHEMRYQKYFRDGGRFFLDAGCGGEPRPKLAENFQAHICVDISLKGLEEARSVLGDSGAYVLADLTALPFKDHSFDGVLASHCLYHIERDSQVAVLNDLYRATKANRNILVFYSSRHNLISLIHKVPRLVVPLINKFLNRAGLHISTVHPYMRRIGRDSRTVGDVVPQLYSYAHNPMKLARGFNSVDVTCLMSLSIYDTQLLRRLRLLGVVSPLLDLLERAFPHAMRYVGKFACVRICKT